MEDKMSYLQKNLVLYRKMAGVTQKELAAKLGISPTTLAGYENAGKDPKIATLIKLADFYGVSVDNLVRDSNFDEFDSKRQVLFDANLLKLPDEQKLTLYKFMEALREFAGEGFTVKTKIVKA